MIYTLLVGCGFGAREIDPVSESKADFWPLINLTLANKAAYCALHGYQLLLRRYSQADLHRQRLEITLAALDTCDCVFFMGADTLITNLDTRLESIDDGVSDWIAAKDINGINNDVFLLRNNGVSRTFLKACLSQLDCFPHDQAAMTAIHGLISNLRTHIVPGKVMNACPYEAYHYGAYPQGQWEQGDFVFHAPGMSLENKLKMIAERIPLIRGGG